MYYKLCSSNLFRQKQGRYIHIETLHTTAGHIAIHNGRDHLKRKQYYHQNVKLSQMDSAHDGTHMHMHNTTHFLKLISKEWLLQHL